ncbi:MAG: hypothetical protein ACR2PB_08605, partial [Desulfocapsaceae bacterium]
ANILQFMEDDFLFTKSFFNNHLHQRGTAPKDKLTFAIHHRNSVANNWRYLSCPLHGITIYPDNNELQSVAMPGMHKFTLSFEEEFLETVSENIGLPNLKAYITKGRIALCEPDQIEYLQRYLILLTHYLIDTKISGDIPQLSTEFKQEVASILLITLSTSSYDLSNTKHLGRARTFDRLMNHVNLNFAELPSISELCSIAGLTERNLKNLFYETFQVCPEDYFKCYRDYILRR